MNKNNMHNKYIAAAQQLPRPTARKPQRRRLVWVCTLGLGSLYLGFLILVAFRADWIDIAAAAEVANALLWGLGLLVLLLSFVLASLYFGKISRDYTDLNSLSVVPMPSADHHDAAAAEVCQSDRAA